MIKPTVLISCVGNKASLVRAFQEAGWHVIGVDKNNNVATKFVCDEFVELDYTALLHKPIQADLIVPTSDSELMWWAQNKNKFDCPIMVADPRTIFITQNKRVFTDFLRKTGFRAASVYDYQEAMELLDSQVRTLFVRVTNKIGGSRYSHIVGSRKALEQIASLYGQHNLLVQSHHARNVWKEYSVDLFVSFEGAILGIVPRRRITIVNGETWYGKVCLKNHKIIDESIRLAESLQLVGHNTLQCFYSQYRDDILWIEVNARFGGGFPLALKAGLDSPALLKLGKQQSVQHMLIDGIEMFRYTDNYFEQV